MHQGATPNQSRTARPKIRRFVYFLKLRTDFTANDTNKKKKDVIILRATPPSTATGDCPTTILPIVDLLHHVPPKIPSLTTTNPHNHWPPPISTTTYIPDHLHLHLPDPLPPTLDSRPILLRDTSHHLNNLLHYKSHFPTTHAVRRPGPVAVCDKPTPYDDTTSYVLRDSDTICDRARCGIEAKDKTCRRIGRLVEFRRELCQSCACCCGRWMLNRRGWGGRYSLGLDL
ncbi:hypothetical protein C7212DRAFT_340736 [Tuber magnatum]|uniref:Uncharacterized protein n=1 Tax=Tuber magnatum TaxID=42249 RepID=A0A317T0D9_9PEZI|nr:hypothetical protein C7212DRAFT_340736 [Tuber magnatum]